MEYPRIIFGIPMQYLGISMEHLWNINGIPMDYLWNNFGISMEYQENTNGITVADL